MQIKRGVLLTTIGFLVHFACAAQLLPRPLPSQEETIPSSYQDSFGPTVDVSSVRFVIAEGGTLFLELSNDQARLMRECAEIYEIAYESDWDHLEHLLPRATQRKLFARIPETRGDPYTIFFPAGASFQQRSLKGLTLQFVGAGTFEGLWGILGNAKENFDDWQVVGLAFPGRFAARGRALPSAPGNPLSDADKAALVNALLKEPGNDDLTLVSAEPVPVDFRRVPGAAAIVQATDGDQYLFCLRKDMEEWKVVPFGPKDEDLQYAHRVDGGGIAFLEPNAERGDAFIDSKLLVLPDMDGDGNSELMLDSAATAILFSVRLEKTHNENMCFVREIRGISFAS